MYGFPIRCSLLATIVLALVVPPARADLTRQIQPVSVASSAKVALTDLASAVSQDLVIQTDTDWLSA